MNLTTILQTDERSPSFLSLVTMKKLLYLLLLLLACACGEDAQQLIPEPKPTPEEGKDDDEDKPQPGEIVIADNYFPLTEENSKVTAYDGESGTVAVNISDTTLVPRVGQVFVVVTDTMGAIRRITAVESKQGQKYTLQTEKAALGDIFESGEFIISSSKEAGDSASTRSNVPVFYPTKIVYMDGDSLVSTRGSINKRFFETDITLENIPEIPLILETKEQDWLLKFYKENHFSSSLDVIMEFNFDKPKQLQENLEHNLLEFSASFVGNLDMNMKFDFSWKRKSEEIKFLEKKFMLKDNLLVKGFWVVVYSVPVFISAEIDLCGEVGLGFSNEFSLTAAGGKHSTNCNYGFSYKQATNNLTIFNNPKPTYMDSYIPIVDNAMTGELQFTVYPRALLKLYALLGPEVSIKPYAKIKAQNKIGLNLNNKTNKLGNAFEFVMSGGIDLVPRLVLGVSGETAITTNPYQIVQEREWFRAPKKIEKKEVQDAEDGSKKVVFAVYDTLPEAKKVVQSTLPIPVVVTATSTPKSDAETPPTAETPPSEEAIEEYFGVLQATNGEVSLPIETISNTTEDVTLDIEATIYDIEGAPIDNASHSLNVESDVRDMLIALYKATDGDNWDNNTNWCSDQPVGSWYGVSIDPATGNLSLDLDGNNLKGVADMSGCKTLTYFDVSFNNLTGVKVANCPLLETLNCSRNNYDNGEEGDRGSIGIDASGCAALKEIECDGSQLTYLNLEGSMALTSVYCANNLLVELDLSNRPALTYLNCSDNQLNKLWLSGCSVLKDLDCSGNQFVGLDLKDLPSIKDLRCYDNQLKTLTFAAEAVDSLIYLDCRNNLFETLNLSGCAALTGLDCPNNQLTSLDLSGCTALTYLGCEYNQLTSLDLSGCTALTNLVCHDNQLTSLDLSDCTALVFFTFYHNQLTELDLSGHTALKSINSPISAQGDKYLKHLDLSGCTALEKLDVQGRYFDYENDQFANNVLETLNLSGCTSLTSLSCSYNQLTSLDLSGCIALTDLDCTGNQLTSLDLSGCIALTDLDCSNNQLTSLDLSGCIALTDLDCSNNQLTSLDLSDCMSLTDLKCYGNQLTELDLSGHTALKAISCVFFGNKYLKHLNLSGCTSLEKLDVQGEYYENDQRINGVLETLNLSGCAALIELECLENQLISLDLSGCTALAELKCSNNQLTSLDLSDCLYTLTKLDCRVNKICSVIPNHLIDIWYKFNYDQRYIYDSYYDKRYTDKGVGWWYPGEPDKGYHGK